MKTIRLISRVGMVSLLLLLAACGGKEKKMAKGFALPDGDIEKGKQAFVEMQCHRCHSVSGETFPEPGEPSEIKLHLGGEVYRVKTYGELVTSIISPEHVVSKEYLQTLDKDKREGAVSPMPSANDKMTVAQMIDIVAFLNAHYVKMQPEYDGPPYYGP